MKTCKSLIFGMTLIATFFLLTTSVALSSTLILQKSPVNTHGFTGLPLTNDGWTDFRHMIREQNLYQDARVVFVSNSNGNDSTGEIYDVNAITFDSNGMFQPVGTVNAFKTMSEAYNNMRSGYPDIILLERGSEWGDGATFGPALKSGRSITERHIIASYGSGDRPKIFNLYLNGRLSRYLIVSGLHGWHDNWFESGRFINITNEASQHQLYEDLRSDKQYNNKIQGGESGFIENIVIRRCVFTDYAAWDGIFYTHYEKNLLLEENIFYKPQRERLDTSTGQPYECYDQVSDDTYWCHGRSLYQSSGSLDNSNGRNEIFIRRNIFYWIGRGTDHRRGAHVDNNLHVRSGIGFGGGGSSTIDFVQSANAVNNVFMQSASIRLTNIDGALIQNNIFTDPVAVTGALTVIYAEGGTAVKVAKNQEISHNIIYGFRAPGSTGRGIQHRLVDVENVSVHNNDIQMVTGSSDLMEAVGLNMSGIRYYDNRYYSTHPANSWFSTGSLNGWIAHSGETGAQAIQVSYPDPSRTIRSYNVSLGGNADTEEFMNEVIQQSRHNWRPEYTACAVNNYVRDGFGKKPVECNF